MNKSDNITDLCKALAKFQGEVKDPRKDSENPFFKSNYVELDSLLSSVRPALTANGLSFIQQPSSDGQNVSITTLIMHKSGQFLESDPLIMRPVKNDPQGIGSCITYGRRYALSAILGIAWDDDDDGNQASSKTPPNDSKSNQKAAPPSGNVKEQQKTKILLEIANEAKKNGIGGQEISLIISHKFGKSSSKELLLSECCDLKENWIKYWQEYCSAQSNPDDDKKLMEGIA